MGDPAEPRAGAEAAGGPNSQSAFPHIARQGDEKAAPAKFPSDIARSETTAAEHAEVFTGTGTNNVVSSAETAEKVCRKSRPGRLRPVGGEMLAPLHVMMVHGCLAGESY